MATTCTDMRQNCTAVTGTSAGLVSRSNQERTLHLAGTNSEAGHIPKLRLDTRPDYGHMWHPDSYGTHFTNGTLTIAVNGLSLEKNGCDPNRIPPWAFENVDGLLLDAEEVRARPTNFTVKDCFPPGTIISDVNAQSLAAAAQMVQASNVDVRRQVDPSVETMRNGETNQGPMDEVNTQQKGNPKKGGRNDVELLTPQTKKQKTLRHPNYGHPLHLSNLKKKSSRLRGRNRGGRSTATSYVDLEQQEGQWCEVVVSPSKEMEEA
ncbi:hypothetical protein ACFX15_009619 [Malus domestica]